VTLPERIRVLLVEDVSTDAELEVRELKRAGMALEHKRVDTEERFRAELESFSPHVIISDFSMPHFDGMSALALARELAPDTPFLFVSGTIGEEYAIRALKNGATDYVLKTNLVRLPAAVDRALQDARERRARRKAEKKLAQTRERLQSIYESIPDVLWSAELPDEHLVYMSPACAEIYGLTPEEFMRRQSQWMDMIHVDDRPKVRAAWARLLEGAPLDVEYRIIRPDGYTRWLNDRGRLIRDPNGRPMRLDGLARDITDAVRQRERVARLARIRDLLGAANAAFMRIRQRDALFAEFCRIAVARGGFVLARIVTLDGEGKASVAATTEDAPGAFAKIIDDYNRDPAGADSLLAHGLRSGQVTVSNDIRADKRVELRYELAQTENYALVILPVRVDGRIVAAAVLRAREANFFDQEELSLLGEIVHNLEFALELQVRQEKLDYLSLYDPLTDLPNRTLFHDRLTQSLEAARRSSTMLSLAVFDIERFKVVNDAYGQNAGDDVLREAARRLRDAVGDINRVARLGGNVFAVMRSEVQDAADAARLAQEKIARVAGPPIRVDDHEIRIALKAGIALFPDDGVDADALFRNAEASLQRGKQTGERILFYAPHINARVSEQVDLENRLRRAVEQRELFLHYQPKVDLATRAIVGLEALMRWRGPDGLFVSPARFIPILEDTGLILDAGKLALQIAAQAFGEWQAKGIAAPRIAVNVSALQIRQKDFVEQVQAVLGGGDSGVDLEITESLLMQDVDSSIRKLKALREAGLHISLDDFGTGHSSLAYLSRLPIDTLKIDRAFVHGMTEKAGDTSIVTAIISLAQALRLSVVAEGVETEEQARMLRLLRCDQMQGYLFSPPVPQEKIEALLGAPAA